jgi:hypothetical protein
MKINVSNDLVPNRGADVTKSDPCDDSSLEEAGERILSASVPDLPHSRRNFLKLSGLVLASQALPAAAYTPNVNRTGYHTAGFEVASSLYAWELHDEGIEHILDNLQQMAEVNSVYLVALMHYEKRPLTSDVFPHNPVRKTWQTEDSKVYWHPDMKMYKRIKPELSIHDWLNGTDWVNVLTAAARKRGLKTGAELSHTLVSREDGESKYPDCVQRNIHGQFEDFGKNHTHPLCPNSVDAQEYSAALYTDLLKNHDLDFVQTCMVPFMPGGAADGGCWCENCAKAARTEGIDWEGIKKVLLANPESPRELQIWQQFRERSMIRFYRIQHEAIHKAKPTAEFRFNDAYYDANGHGLDIAACSKHWDSVRNSDYSEQKGYPSQMDHKREWFKTERAALGPSYPFIGGVAVRPQATPELIREGVKITLEVGGCGVSLGHYDGAEWPMLRAIKEELTAEHVYVPAKLARKA